MGGYVDGVAGGALLAAVLNRVDEELHEAVPGLVTETRNEDERGADATLHEAVLGQGAGGAARCGPWARRRRATKDLLVLGGR
eukprot:4833209-Alexandrium_andersonii.AAC.1